MRTVDEEALKELEEVEYGYRGGPVRFSEILTEEGRPELKLFWYFNDVIFDIDNCCWRLTNWPLPKATLIFWPQDSPPFKPAVKPSYSVGMDAWLK